MPAPSDEPLRTCNIKLYAKDQDWLWRTHGHGWTTIVRQLVRKHIRETEQQEEPIVWPSQTTK